MVNLGPLSKIEHLTWECWFQDGSFGTREEIGKRLYASTAQNAAIRYVCDWDEETNYGMAKRGATIVVCVLRGDGKAIDIIEVAGSIEPSYDALRIDTVEMEKAE